MNAPATWNCDIARCFCETPMDELRLWAVRKYRQGMSTLALMEMATSDHDREMIAIVALLEVPDEELLKAMSSVDKPAQHILQCRERFRDLLT